MSRHKQLGASCKPHGEKAQWVLSCRLPTRRMLSQRQYAQTKYPQHQEAWIDNYEEEKNNYADNTIKAY